MRKHITQIPVPGNSAKVPTGAMQFQDDWPGLFIRGDDAIPLHSSIRQLQQRLGDHADVVIRLALERLGRLADIIEQNVIVADDGA